MAVAAILGEFSKRSSEIYDGILLFLCFLLENSWSQLCKLPKAMTGIKCECEKKGYFSVLRGGLQMSGKEIWLDFWVEHLSATLCILFENLQVMYWCWLTRESQIYQTKLYLFSDSCNKMESKSAHAYTEQTVLYSCFLLLLFLTNPRCQTAQSCFSKVHSSDSLFLQSFH